MKTFFRAFPPLRFALTAPASPPVPQPRTSVLRLPLAPLSAAAAVLCGLVGAAPANAASRPGAARVLPLRLEAGAGEPASLVQASACTLEAGIQGGARTDGPGVFFMRESDGESAVWLGQPSPDGRGAQGFEDSRAGEVSRKFEWTGRGWSWAARPVLRARAPWRLASPVPVDGGRVLLLNTDAPSLEALVNGRPGVGEPGRAGRRGTGGAAGGAAGGAERARSRVAWLEVESALEDGSSEVSDSGPFLSRRRVAVRGGFLSPPDVDSYDACLSPDGRRISFTTLRAGRESVFCVTLASPLLGGGADEGWDDPWRVSPPRLVVESARGARWLDARTLVFESTRAGGGRSAPGLHTVALSATGTAGEPRLLLARAREAAVAPNGRAIAAVMPASTSGASSGAGSAGATVLVLCAPDGSGARLLTDTRGARRPCFSSDGRAILFDAPQSTAGATSSGAPRQSAAPADTPFAVNSGGGGGRSLWSVPLLRTPPVAILASVAPRPPARTANTSGASRPRPVASGEAEGAEGALAVVGTAFSEEWGPLSVRVEVGAGESPTNWSLLGERSAPAQNEVLALWKPPPGARGDWSLRLRVRDAAGDEAESLLPVTLPLLLPLNPATITPATPAVAIAAVPAATNPTSTSGNAKSPNPGARATPPGRSPARTTTTRPATSRTPARATGGASVPILPLPALPPPPATPAAPPRSPAETVGAVLNPGGTPKSTRPGAGTRNPTVPPAPDAVPVATDAVPMESVEPDLPRMPRVDRAPESASPALAPPPQPRAPGRALPPRTGSRLRPTPSAPPKGRAVANAANSSEDRTPPPNPTPRAGDDPGDVEVLGLPAEMQPGETVTVKVRWSNRSGAAWQSKSADGTVLRLVQRFVDRKGGYRRGWKYAWLRADTPSGGRGEQEVRLTAPGPGRYRVTFSLLRIGPEGFTPPPANDYAAQVRWPGEIVQAVYAVEVKP